LNSSFLDPSFLEWRLGCKTCIVYTGLNGRWSLPRCSNLQFLNNVIIIKTKVLLPQA
jgi:hypothetical protein